MKNGARYIVYYLLSVVCFLDNSELVVNRKWNTDDTDLSENFKPYYKLVLAYCWSKKTIEKSL